MRLVVSLLVLVAVASGVVGWAALRAPAPDARIEASIGGRRVVFPATLARDASTRSGGLTDRLAFLATFPEFAPRPAQSRPATSAATGADALVFIALSPRSDALDPAERPARLYARFLESEVGAGPAGLVARRFERGSPYEGEILYLAPPDGRIFFARCPEPGAGRPVDAPSCLWALRWTELDVELRFASALLAHWELLVGGLPRFLRAIDASGTAGGRE